MRARDGGEACRQGRVGRRAGRREGKEVTAKHGLCLLLNLFPVCALTPRRAIEFGPGSLVCPHDFALRRPYRYGLQQRCRGAEQGFGGWERRGVAVWCAPMTWHCADPIGKDCSMGCKGLESTGAIALQSAGAKHFKAQVQLHFTT